MPTKKKTTNKTAPKKAAAKKVTKPVKKAAKPASKSTPAPKKAEVKKTVAPKAPAPKAVKAKAEPQKTPAKADAKPEKNGKAAPELDEKAKAIVLGARKRTSTPAHFKPRKSKNTPIMFTMEDVAELLEKRKDTSAADAEQEAITEKARRKIVAADAAPTTEQRNHSAASLADILGFNPAEKKTPHDVNEVPKKWIKNYKALLDLRDHVSEGLALHTADTLKRSSKDDSGDLSGYGQHMADAGTDTFDRDFALSLVSNEQEALYEIEEAIQRIFDDTYGVCEITGEPIDKERLMAVPFTRFSLQGQRELERNRRRKQQRGGVFGDADETVSFGDDDGDE